ncbi:MAG: flavodoxin family protein [Clostridia bacterium]|nr:flavodoxin family protein [Oscillospiraceae bacterium]MBR4892951.1 flavodoxin family protein [Clostridia bacterium]
MKVALINGSPHEMGSTYGALLIAGENLKKEGIDYEIFWIGNKPVSGCLGCGACRKLGKCVIEDSVNQFAKIAHEFDGFIFGTPVHFAAMGGQIASFMDRLFFSANKSGAFYLKPASAIAVARRAGTTATIDQINKYFLFAHMPVISSRYWNVIHGTNKDEILKDEEGVQIIRILAKNMAFFLKCKEAGLKAGILPPEPETQIPTNFIR